MSEKKSLGRSTPPEGEEDHGRIWSAVDKAEKMWIIVGPLHAVQSNWRALVWVAVGIGVIMGPEIITYLASFWGVAP